MNFPQGNHKLRLKNAYERKHPLKKIAKMTVTYNKDVFSYGHLSDFLKSDFLFHIHFSVVICDFLVISS
jgi:hypothetical protein